MRECNPRNAVIQDDDGVHRRALGCLVFAARFTGVIWVARGVAGALLLASPELSVGWYGVDPSQWDKYHLAYLAYLRMIMVVSEIYYGGFLIVSTMFADVRATKNCVILNSWMLFIHGLVLMWKKIQFFDNGGFAFDSMIIVVDVIICDLIPIVICAFATCITDSNPGLPSTGELCRTIVFFCYFPANPKKNVFGVGLVIGFFAILNGGLFQADWVVTQITTPEFMTDPGFSNLLRGWLGLLAVSYVTPVFTCIMFYNNDGAALDYHCSRCLWTWSCANVVCWLAFKLFCEANSLPNGFASFSTFLAVVFAAMVCRESLFIEAEKPPELIFRHTWMTA